jgi:hypothetical protein
LYSINLMMERESRHNGVPTFYEQQVAYLNYQPPTISQHRENNSSKALTEMVGVGLLVDELAVLPCAGKP